MPARLRAEADAINLMHDPTGNVMMIPKSLVMIQLIEKIRAGTGQRYVATMDVLKHQNLNHGQYVQRLQEKFLEEQQIGGLESANAVLDGSNTEESVYSAMTPRGRWTNTPKQGGDKPGKLEVKYCWLFAKTGECRFGSDCKFKHIKKSELPEHDETAHIVQWADSIAKNQIANTALLAKTERSRNHWKKMYQSKGTPRPTAGRPPGERNITYEETVKKTASAYHANEEKTFAEDSDSMSPDCSDPDYEGSECE